MHMIKRLGLTNSSLTIYTKILLLFRKLRKKISKPILLPRDSERMIARLPPGGESISLEAALNSRCTSDYNGNQKISHWGMFDRSHKLSDINIQRIINLSHMPRYTAKSLGIRVDRNNLVFVADSKASGIERHWLMVESGMQQQAVLLTCAALGVGSSIFGLGINGKVISDNELATVHIMVSPMNPSYSGSYWSNSVPINGQKWKTGNLPDPCRTGDVPLLSALTICNFHNASGKQTSTRAIGQLLWAARGRTPHYYNSVPWGLTIPTWGGRQDISRLNVVYPRQIYSYQNWHQKKPTHSLVSAKELNDDCLQRLADFFPSWNSFLILSVKENNANNYWEVGYQLLNILLQARVLDVEYMAILLEESQKEIILDDLAIPNAAVLVAIRTESPVPFIS